MTDTVKAQYGNKTLVGNWFDDRLEHKSEQVLENPQLARTGRFKDFPMRRDEYVNKDMYRTTNQDAYQAPKSSYIKKEYKMVTTANMSRYMNDGRILKKEYGSILPYHNEERDLRLLTTTHHSQFGGKYADTEEKVKLAESQLNDHSESGFGNRVERTGAMKSFGATGERLKKDNNEDPKNHTLVQRSWLYDRSSYSQYDNNNTKSKNVNQENITLVGLGQKKTKKLNFHRVKTTTGSSDGIWSG